MLNRFNAALDNIPLWKKGIAVVSIPLLMLLLTLLLTGWHEKVARDAQGWIQHSLEVKASIYEVLSLTTAAETAVRGYLLWNDPVYLDPYNEARIKLEPTIQQLTELVKDNSDQTSMTRQLRSAVSAKMDVLATMRTNLPESVSAGSPIILKSRHQMEEVRSVLKSMAVSEDSILGDRINDYNEIRHRLNISLGVLLLLAVLCGLTASYIVSASILMRVNNLETYARQVSRGQTAMWKDSGLDELGSLGHSVQVMTNNLLIREEALRDARGQLESANDNLAAQLQETQNANRELEAFSYSVSHDLRAPLRHVAGFSELMLKNADSLDSKNQRYLNIISSSIRQMGVLIDDLLAFSRMGRASLKSDPVDLNETIGDVMVDLGPDMQNRNVQWEIGQLPTVLGDKGTIRLVMQNLMGNALKYSRSRDPAIIKIALEEQQKPEMAKIVVSDNGVGFDMNYKDKLFGVFQRLHNSEDFEGTGIGLATVRRIVQRHGGDVTAEGEIDKGARFSFTLPTERKS